MGTGPFAPGRRSRALSRPPARPGRPLGPAPRGDGGQGGRLHRRRRDRGRRHHPGAARLLAGERGRAAPHPGPPPRGPHPPRRPPPPPPSPPPPRPPPPSWGRPRGVTAGGEAPFTPEDGAAVGAIPPEQPGYWGVSVNGLPHSWVPFGGLHPLLGAIPAVIHPAPREVAVIGLGSGETAWAAACRRETRSVRVFEIFASQPQLLAGGAAAAQVPALRSLLRDGRGPVQAAGGPPPPTPASRRGLTYALFPRDEFSTPPRAGP